MAGRDDGRRVRRHRFPALLLERLRHIRDITPNAGGGHLLLFNAHRADRHLRAEAERIADIHVVDLERLYTGS